MKKPQSPVRLNLYPLVIPLFPVFSFILHNLKIVSLSSIATVILLPTAALLVVWFVIRRLVPDPDKASLIVTTLGIFFFTYRHFQTVVSLLLILINGSTFDAIEKFGLVNNHPEVARGILLGWVLVAAAVVIGLSRARANFKQLSVLLNAVSAIIVVLLLGNWAITLFSERNSVVYRSNWENTIAALDTEALHCPDNPPDIFYIVPDTYTNEETLENVFQFDNADFVQFLKKEGFVVVEDGRSNYAQTPLSIASSLNFMYLDEVAEQMGQDSDNRSPLQEMIQRSKIEALLRACGYKTVAFSSGFGSTELTGSDHYLTPRVAISDLENEILNLTPLPPLMTALSVDNRYQLQRDRILFALDQLPRVREQFDGPLFVFVHFTAPHHPFVFDADGKPVNPTRTFTLSEDFQGEGKQEYMRGYVGQLAFMNNRLKEILPQIIAQDPEGTVIVLQGDHGSSSQLNWDDPDEAGMRERTSILNAYYLPAQQDDPVLKTITPVNTFRVILNTYFGAGLPILENTVYFSTLNALYQFQELK